MTPNPATTIAPITRMGPSWPLPFEHYSDYHLSSLQAYAQCGCDYALPAEIANCANVALNIRPDTPASLLIYHGAPQTSSLLTGPISPTAAPTKGGPAFTLLSTRGLSSSPVALHANGQITSTGLSTYLVTKTSTITSCAPTATTCPASLPATSTYAESETRTILSCEGGCTGLPPAGAKDVCVRRVRKRAVVLD